MRDIQLHRTPMAVIYFNLYKMQIDVSHGCKEGKKNGVASSINTKSEATAGNM